MNGVEYTNFLAKIHVHCAILGA